MVRGLYAEAGTKQRRAVPLDDPPMRRSSRSPLEVEPASTPLIQNSDISSFMRGRASLSGPESLNCVYATRREAGLESGGYDPTPPVGGHAVNAEGEPRLRVWSDLGQIRRGAPQVAGGRCLVDGRGAAARRNHCHPGTGHPAPVRGHTARSSPGGPRRRVVAGARAADTTRRGSQRFEPWPKKRLVEDAIRRN